MSNFEVDAYHLTLILISLISGVLSPVVIQLTRYYISLLKSSKSSKPEEMLNILRLESKIMTKLESIRADFNADRAGIIEFHNGGHTFTGRSIQKFSQTYEANNRGISKESSNTQNIPTSLFSTILSDIAKEGSIIVKDSSEVVKPFTSTFNDFLSNRGVKSFVGIEIKNLDDEFIGILTIENVLKNQSYSASDINNLKLQASVLAGYLESILKSGQSKI